MALCKDKSTCDDDSWGPDAVMDLYIDGISVSEAQCSDPVGAPDPIVSFSVGGQVYVESCNDAYSCTFSPPLKISKVTMSQFLQGKVAFKIEDSDESLDDSCWSGALPAPVARDFGGLVYKPGDGTVTYHLKPTGK